MTVARALRNGWTLALLATATACTSILGVTDLPPATDGDGGGNDAGSSSSGSSSSSGGSGSSGGSTSGGSSGVGSGGSSGASSGGNGSSNGSSSGGTPGGDGAAGPQPAVFLGGLGAPYAIAVDANNVYWTTTGASDEIEKCAIGGCANPTVIASGQISVESVAVDSAGVFWDAHTFVGACTTGSCGASPTALFLGSWAHVTADATNVYATGLMTSGGGAVVKCASTGCGQAPQTVASSPSWVGGSVVVDSSNVYWTTTPYVAGVTSQVLECPINGTCSTPTVLATGLANAHSIALDAAGNVYFAGALTSSAVDQVMKCPAGGCSGGVPAVFASPTGAIDGIVADAANVYFTVYSTSTGGSVASCAVGGCSAPTTLASSQGQPEGIAIDATTIYWADESSGNIMKLPKP